MREDLKTDRDGRFVIDGLDEGTINIVVFGEGEGVDWTYRPAQDVVLRSGETSDITIELIRGVEIEGKIVAGGSDAPVAEHKLVFMDLIVRAQVR